MNNIKPFKKNKPINNTIDSVFLERQEKEAKKQLRQYCLYRSLENVFKIGLNLGIIAFSITSVKNLLPYNDIQQSQISQIEAEINKVSPRVQRLEENFSTTFDPKSSRRVMKDNTYKVDPNLRPIFFVEER
ncbi:MAG: slr1601 family putative cell division protein [Cyanobacterium sp.]